MRPKQWITALALAAGCADRPPMDGPPDPVAAPTIRATSPVPILNDALATLVVVTVQGADSVVVHFHLGDTGSADDSVAPAARAVYDTARVRVLGLLPARRYVLRAVAFGPGGTVTGDSTEFTTDSLPPDLPRYTAGGPAPAPGYVVFAAGKYGLVIDNTGRVVWYHRFPDGAGLNFQAQPSGRYVARPPTPDPSDVELWVELDPAGAVTRSFGCAAGLPSRPHDLISELDGSYWIMCDEMRTMDLTGVGGVAAARVTGTVVQHVSTGGELLFQWSPFDHFAITDLDSADRTGASVNWTHGNALDFEADGNLLVSFRSLGEITKIDVTTGDVIWRLGGRRNQFVFENTPVPAFARQHGLRVCPSGTLLLLDNAGDPSASRAERYALDEATLTARLVGSYSSLPGVVTPIGGSVQDLPGGHTLVSFGQAGRVEEYDASGAVVWRILGNAGYVFRAQRIRSLYEPGVGTPR